MAVFALADLHLAFSVPDKNMEFFGPSWSRYTDRIETAWKGLVGQEDLVLLPGDISWAMTPEAASIDLRFIDSLPGTKVMIRGNHDYWWTSLSKIKQVLPPSIHLIQNDVFNWKGISIGGARLWDTPEYNFGDAIEYKENPREKKQEKVDQALENEKIFVRELNRLELSLQQIDPQAKIKIAMTHYPPIGASLISSRASAILEKYNVDICVFGHLHNVRENALPFGEKKGVRYLLTSADYLKFIPLKLVE